MQTPGPYPSGSKPINRADAPLCPDVVDGAVDDLVVDVRVLELVVVVDDDAVVLELAAVLFLLSFLFINTTARMTAVSTRTKATTAAMMIGAQLRFGG